MTNTPPAGLIETVNGLIASLTATDTQIGAVDAAIAADITSQAEPG